MCRRTFAIRAALKGKVGRPSLVVMGSSLTKFRDRHYTQTNGETLEQISYSGAYGSVCSTFTR